MAKITIIDGNDEIELSTAPKENIKAFMVKGEPGSDGVSPEVEVSKTGGVATINITDAEGTKSTSINDGFSPIVDVSKSNRVTTISITDEEGTETATISDGIDLTGGVPTNGVIGFDGTASEIPNGYEVSTDGIATQTDLATKQDTLVSGTNIKTVNNTSLLGSGNVNISGANAQNTYNTSTTDPYSCNYVNGLNTYSTTEQRIGTWVDNKPLYRKVINITSYYPNGISADSQVTFQHNISNFDALIDARIIRTGSNPLEYKSLSYIQYITDNSRNEFNIYAGNYGLSIGSNQTLYLIVEYTKSS